METKTLLRAGLKTHRSSLAGIAALLFLVSLTLCATLVVWSNARRYLDAELDRLGYGDLTVWVSGLENAAPLTDELAALDEVAAVGVQSLVFSEYETGGQESDSEGQLVVYDPAAFPYRFFRDDRSGYRAAPAEIAPGEVYVPASLVSMFGVEAGDEIVFPIARSGVDVTLRVAGFFEDPFMGSSMIGMKSFLISSADHDRISALIAENGIDALARTGYMLHIAQHGSLPAAAFNALLNQSTHLQSYSAFSHSRTAIAGFMLTLQNVFTAMLLAFAAVLTLAALAVLSHSIGSTIAENHRDMAILKTVGFTSGALRVVQLWQYLLAALTGMLPGAALALPAASLASRMTVTATGLLIPSALPMELCLPVLAGLLVFIAAFVWLRAGRIGRIRPMQALRDGQTTARRAATPLHRKALGFWLALRQLAGCAGRYTGACLVAALLVFFASLTGRVNDWLGPNGEGLMDAFNPADLHIAAQPMGTASLDAVEALIESYTPIADSYALAMPGVSVDGVDMTANVITDPARFHILAGRSCAGPDEVVLTEFAAADLGVSIGDTVMVMGSQGRAGYTVSGIYQCANDMGLNLGMSREGYLRVGADSPNLWCTHYFLTDPSLQPAVMQALENAFGREVYLHENSWPGLAGILAAMALLTVILYGMTAAFVLVVTLLTAQKLLRAEQRDLGVYRALGFSAGRLRCSFALRFALVSAAGSVLGTAASALLTDPLAGLVMRMEGISGFASHPGPLTVLMPGTVVTALSVLFAWLEAGRIGRTPLTALAKE